MGGWGSASLLPPVPAGLTGTAWLRIHSGFTPRHGGRLPRRKPAWKRGKEPRISCSCSAPKAELLLLLSGLLMPVLLRMELAPLWGRSPRRQGRALSRGLHARHGYRSAPVPRWEQFLPPRLWHLLSSFDVAAFLGHR